MKRIVSFMMMLVLFLGGCAQRGPAQEGTYKSKFKKQNIITISDEKIELNGKTVGNKKDDVFISRDIIYYEDKESYASGNLYGEGGPDDMHTKEEAETHTVINITESGAYRILGTLSAGQIRVDLGEEAEENPGAVVELILDGADITCTVAPAILFMNVYECDGDADEETATSEVDTSKSGAVLVLAEGSENNISGSYVEKIFEDNTKEEKLWKQDGAIYSYMSMNIEGSGTLNLTAENEGLDTELHLTINGGNINIRSQNDGINTNEDNVSVTTINGGNLNIIAGLGEEGDGIDSNGWLVINGGAVISSAKPMSDSGLDSDLGSFINGGTVVALGSAMDWPESDSNQVAINLQFTQMQNVDSEIVIKNKEGESVFSFKQAADAKHGFSGAVISSPEFKVNDEYTVYVSGTQQGYYGTDLPRRDKPMMPAGMERPEFDGERPPMPPKFNGEMQRKPEGEPRKMPDGEMGHMPFMKYEPGEQKTVFIMKDKVNLFSGVSAIK